MIQARRTTLVWVTTALLFAGCGGGDEAPRPTGRAMTAPAPAQERAVNHPPSIAKIEFVPETPRPGDAIEARVDAEDPDGDGLRLTFEWYVNGRLAEGQHRALLVTDELHRGDRVELRVVASDGRLESPVANRAVRIGNRPPQLQGVAFSSSGDVRRGDPIDASPVASDPDGDALTFSYRWYVNGRAVDQKAPRFDTKDLKRGDRVHVEVVATDGTDQTESVRSAALRIGNSPPRILGVPPVENVKGEFRYAFQAKDPDGDRRLRFRLAEAPAGMTIDAAKGTARWRPDATQVGTHPVEVVVEDAYGDGSALRFEVTVTAQPSGPAAAAAK